MGALKGTFPPCASRLALAALILGLLFGATAQAQDPPYDAGVACEEATDAPAGCDTEYTPVAKDADEEVWVHEGGARFDEGGELVAGSPTPYTVDFFAVRFQTPELGFAGGAACADPNTPFEAVDGCERVPVIYRFLDPDGAAGELPGSWEEHWRGTTRGYVGSIAFISSAGEDAIAVGGTGSYPRRELGRCEAGETNADDPACEHHDDDPATTELDDHYAARDLAGEEQNAAGRARVWTHQGGTWSELTDLPQTPAGEPMRGLSAVDCSPLLQDGRRCLAGAYRQLWLWQGNGFTTAFTDARFRFRVRAIRFDGRDGNPATAVTSGCCAERKSLNQPADILFDGDSIRTQAATDDSSASKRLADSFYSICLSCQNTISEYSRVAAPGGPPPEPPADGVPAPPEPPSRIVRGKPLEIPTDVDGSGGNIASEVLNPNLSSLRLVAGDGDFGRPQASTAWTVQPSGADGLLDWAVGELTSTGQAVAYTTLEGPTPLLDSFDCPAEAGLTNLFTPDWPAAFARCELRDSGEIVTATKSKRLVGLPTYALNAFAYTPATDGAWAAGDKGALVRLGGKGAAEALADEPKPPRLGARRHGELGDRSAYDELAPEGAGPVGAVPPLQSQPLRELAEPELVSAGIPDPTPPAERPREDVEEIVMSRDGSEGWAIGRQGALFRFQAGRWTRCETDSVPGIIEPDPACEALAPPDAEGERRRIGLSVAARIPFERDEDPSNDDEFELLAIGGDKTGPRPVVRYRGGRWSIDAEATKQFGLSTTRVPADIVAPAPDDVWLLTHHTGSSDPDLHHFDGERWINCDGNGAACGDANSLLPANGGPTATLREAGGRVFMAGSRRDATNDSYPLVLTKVPTEPWSSDPTQGGLDPGCVSRETGRCVGTGAEADQGSIRSFSVAPSPTGGYTGWASGTFGTGVGPGSAAGDLGRKAFDPGAPLLRLSPNAEGGGTWAPWTQDELSLDEPLRDRGDVVSDHPSGGFGTQALLSVPGAAGESDAWIVPTSESFFPPAPLLAFGEERWRLAAAPFATAGTLEVEASAVPQAAAPDNQGGFWLAASQAGSELGPYHERLGFFHHTDTVPEPVFSEAPHPIREQITSAEGGPDGSFWVATASSTVYRYDRIAGWDRVRIPGWDPGRTITRATPATDVAVGPGGEGLLVGEGGRIAELTPKGARLDAAAGAALCAAGASEGPCGTGRALRAAAIAPDGAALVGGDARTLLWRPPGGEFRPLSPPATAPNATITAIAYPEPERAYLTTDLGQVWVGELSGSAWRWHVENRDLESGLLVSVDDAGDPLELRAIAVDASGRGYAVGEQGVVIERTGEGSEPWRRIQGFRDEFDSVALPVAGGGGDAALLGGSNGVVYTLSEGELQVAREADRWNPLNTAMGPIADPARIVGLVLLPGAEPGETEAWAASQGTAGRGPGRQGILHYTSDPGDPLLDGGGEIAPLPDVPRPREGELSLAAFGRTECQTPHRACPVPQETETASDAIARRVSEELIAREASSPGPFASVFTGDIAVRAGRDHAGLAQVDAPTDTNVMHRRWAEIVARRFADAGVPLFGALGVSDLAQVKTCPISGACAGTDMAHAGTSTSWRDAMRDMPEPWGGGDALSDDGIDYVPVGGEGLASPPASGGARTHYALDVVRGGEKLMRLVFADNSMRSFAASEPNQAPIEAGGQESWLKAVLCRVGEGAECTRGPDQPAVVVANTPAYSYGPGALEHTATDAAIFERILFEHDVSALVSGRMGWNGLAYARAVGDVPVDHLPGPGGGHPDGPPEPLGPGGEILPEVIAASAGGRFGPNRDEEGSATEGFWHGYTVVRVPASGDPAEVIVEQRPVFDWISLTAPDHAVGPRQRLRLEGEGREVAGTDAPLRYDQIDSAAITHRYDLLLADPEQPWLPCREGDAACESLAANLSAGPAGDGEGEAGAEPAEDRCAPYLCLPERVGTVDGTTGEVRAGDGRYPNTFALALLSVGERAASYPLVFEKSPSFVVKSAMRTAGLPAALASGTGNAPPPPDQPPLPRIPQIEVPAIPPPPSIPPLAAATPPEPTPPAPPAPPPPTEQPSALDLTVSPAGLTVATPAAVIQPPTPPVNPAPPSGARREARQRQAAAQKSGADADKSAGDASELGGDMADNREGAHGSAMTRQAEPGPARQDYSFTRLERGDGSNYVAWGGGLTLAALALALSFSTLRPRSRRREPELPAPAWNRRLGG